ncbi:MAG: ATP-binding protein [Chloroflexota bacterium]
MQEDQHHEWKRLWHDDHLKWIAAFANAQGGTLVIGRNDQGEAIGVPNAKKLMEDIPNKARTVLGIIVNVNLRHENEQDLVEISVSPHPNPISHRGKYYYRSGSTLQELNGMALQHFLVRKKGYEVTWENTLMPSLGLDDCSAAAFKLFRTKAVSSGRMSDAILEESDESILTRLELIEGGNLTRAAGLLFTDTPEQVVTGAYIKIGFFTNDADIRYQDEINGNLFEQVDKAVELLFFKYLKAYIHYEGLQRVDRYLFPRAALREAILNAVIHKDYNSRIPIQLRVYEDQIRLWNPGQLPENWTLEELLAEHKSHPYNPLIANAFYRAGYIESWGRGIEEINGECQAHDIEPPIYDSKSGLSLIFHANPRHLLVSLGEESVQRMYGDSFTNKLEAESKTNYSNRLSGNQALILDLLKLYPGVSVRELERRIGTPSRRVEYTIAQLREMNLLRHTGNPFSGRWEVRQP